MYIHAAVALQYTATLPTAGRITYSSDEPRSENETRKRCGA
jgi:hypothetical protein